MYPVDHEIHGALVAQWEGLYQCAQALSSDVLVQPSDGYAIIPTGKVDLREGSTYFEILPVLIMIPEMSTGGPDLYIVLAGYMTIDRNLYQENNRQLRMKAFGSRIAYFRPVQNGFHHVLGAHYDLSVNALGHPAYHMQFEDYGAEYSGVIRKAFNSDWEVVNNSMERVPRHIRIPCAQLDTFSVATQLIADHLLGRNSSTNDVERFASLLRQSRNLKGTGYLVPRLHASQTYECFRAGHWYPDEAAPQR